MKKHGKDKRRVWRKLHLAVDTYTYEITCTDPTASLSRLLTNGVRRLKPVIARQRLTESNSYWKWNTAYNRRLVAETAMYRVKQLFGGHLRLRDYDAQVGEAMAMIRGLNRMTRAGMPERVRIA